ncbi:hypothetical protein D081_1493 [Anaerovibrio sp. JC8]|uniref:DUF3427 domain-containing protein n=1 Tax=Anaerovibrio sp. JC8 TaxID=1240085 RepID=UPI000A0DB475|nr:DEAD/DEAH box helicase [Anaerovibrio sp. JC8]ORT99912.1 hypothetical protein D081_1493 [Anaerovibrio sp. JC8]
MESGIYEALINKGMLKELNKRPDKCKNIQAIDEEEASNIIAKYTEGVIKAGLDNLLDKKKGIESQVELANKIIELIKNYTSDDYYEEKAITGKGEQLLGLLDENNAELAIGKKIEKIIERPETSIAESSLFTGSRTEPPMFSELKKEIKTATRIDMLVSFIKWTGLRLILEELKDFTEKGGQLRIIATSYMGATDVKAIEALADLRNTNIKISYDTNRTRLHAKAYVFYRNTGFTTAYVGSSNLSNAAISSGLEWNVKLTNKDQPNNIKKIEATFENYWCTEEFESYTHDDKERLTKAIMAEKYIGPAKKREYIFDINPYSYQQEILDKLQVEREERGYYKNLVVAATGTGKTLISAFDYRNFRRKNKGGAKLLFVAHREEILEQSLNVFRGVLKDPNFGALLVGSYKPDSAENLFISIQTAESRKIYDNIPADYYDFIVVDEFHHAAAKSYQNLLNTFTPKILLGLTATPERADGKSIISYFDGRIAAEIRLPEAIDRKLLCPFQYFGVADEVDLSNLKWNKGGYDKTELSNVYTIERGIAEKRAGHIVNSIGRYVTNDATMKCLAFCVSIAHADFMAEYFNKHGLKAISLNASSSDEERNTAKARLVSGEIKIICVVDLYNEGVDIPEVDTVLFLRPTESLTVFLQQLGRGLRLSEGKDCLTVLEFVGQANKKYNFEEKFAALLSNTRHSVKSEIDKGFPSVPKGCFIQLEKKTQEYVLKNISQAFNNRNAIVARIKDFVDESGKELNISNFLQYYHQPITTIYKRYGFYRLCEDAGVIEKYDEPVEELLIAKAFPRLVGINSRRWIKFLLRYLSNIKHTDINSLSSYEKHLVWMFYVTIWSVGTFDENSPEVKINLNKLADSPMMLREIMEILEYNLDKIDFLDEAVPLKFNCPLDLHCAYTKDQILVAMDYFKISSMRQGVLYISDKNTDLFLVTINKSDKEYSPSTMYDDYFISDEFFHWQSQSTTSDTSRTGQRYIHHKEQGSTILLFVRDYKKNEMGTTPYTFVGPVKYVKHTGSRPMNITWKLERPISAKEVIALGRNVMG